MINIEQLHEKAMALAEQGALAQMKGEFNQANDLFKQAYDYESTAASELTNQYNLEPTRSILFRSAASLALDCSEIRAAERLIALGLAGNPPEEIAEELRDLNERVTFERHLSLRGIALAPDEVQMSLAGKAVSFGIAQSEQFIMRIEDFRRLMHRTVERLLNKKYREGGISASEVRDYGLFLSVPRTASFAVSLKVSYPQQPLEGFESAMEYINPSDVIDEIISCLDDYNHERETILKDKIKEEAYYRNFIGIAKSLAPDGQEIKQVGFTTIRKGKEKRVRLTRTRQDMKQTERKLKDKGTTVSRPITITGNLRYADERKTARGIIKLVDDENKWHDVIVPEGMMSDIVKPLWEERVVVSGYIHRGNNIYLEDIDRASKK